MTTGSCWVRASARMRRSTSNPDIFGSFRSRKHDRRHLGRVALGMDARAEKIIQSLGSVPHHRKVIDEVALGEHAFDQMLVIGGVLNQKDRCSLHVVCSLLFVTLAEAM